LFECTTDGVEAWSRACPGEVKDAVAALAGKVLSMTPTAKVFEFLASESP
jgi:hypothetical protein